MKLLSFKRKKNKVQVGAASEEFIKNAYEKNNIEKSEDVPTQQEEELNTELEVFEGNLANKSDRERCIRAYCEQIVEATKQNDNAKLEYQAVTDYLTDIQKIDRVKGEDVETLYSAARNLVTLQKERHSYQNGKANKLSSQQMSFLESKENQIPDDIKKLVEYEEYNTVIKNDMRYLEGEKGALRHQKKVFYGTQNYLKKMAVSIAGLVLTIVVLLYVLEYAGHKDVQIPFLMTIALAAVAGLYLFMAGRKNEYDIKMTQVKLNKAISMLNTVKIKYVNNKKCIDYVYNQYHINSAVELEYQWGQFTQLKRLKEELARNTEKMNEHNEVLTEILRKYGVKDTEIWLTQADAIIDSREMVEIRHRLNVRREKIRDRIAYNTDIIDRGFQELNKIVKQVPEAKLEVAEVIKELQICIE